MKKTPLFLTGVILAVCAILFAAPSAGAQSAEETQMTAAAWLDRGILSASRGDYETAIHDFTEALRLDPAYAAAYFNRGNIYAEREDHDRAMADYEAALRIKADYPSAKNNPDSARKARGY